MSRAWKQQPVPEQLLVMARDAGLEPGRVYTQGPLRAIVARERCGGREADPLRWHISVSCADRVPTWAEMRDAVHDLRPGVMFSIGIPPRSMWLNEHEFVLHAWETVDEALFEDARANQRGDTPT